MDGAMLQVVTIGENQSQSIKNTTKYTNSPTCERALEITALRDALGEALPILQALRREVEEDAIIINSNAD
jgi:hypothetical protein